MALGLAYVTGGISRQVLSVIFGGEKDWELVKLRSWRGCELSPWLPFLGEKFKRTFYSSRLSTLGLE